VTGSGLLRDAFAHHVWATLRIIDACDALSPEQLQTTVPGTYGSVIGTVQHIVGADSWYLFRTSGERTTPIADGAEESMDLAALRSTMEAHGQAWPTVLAQDPDPDTVIVTRRDDGSETRAPMSIRLAQALHHGSDHRSQICTALTTLGLEPPPIDLWDFGSETGSVTEVPAAS
jgi:uncharacterized damage-inducible protein DinB